MELVPPHFGVALKVGRTIRGFTRRELSDRSGVPVWRVSAFEQGRAAPECDEFLSLWHALTTDPPPRPETP